MWSSVTGLQPAGPRVRNACSAVRFVGANSPDGSVHPPSLGLGTPDPRAAGTVAGGWPGAMLLGRTRGFCWAVLYLTPALGMLRSQALERAGWELASSRVLRFAAWQGARGGG